MDSEIIAESIKDKSSVFLFVILMILWNIMFVFYLFISLYDTQTNLSLLISTIIFTLICNIAFVYMLVAYKTQDVSLTKDCLIITKKGQVVKLVSNKNVCFSYFNHSNFIYDGNNKVAYLPFNDLNSIKDNLFKLGYTDIEYKSSTKKDIIITIFALLFIVGFKYAQHYIKQEDIRKDSASYSNYMQHTIKRHWRPSIEQRGLSVTVEYDINKNGQITNIKVSESSNNTEFDNSALEAISKIKLPALPNDINKDSVNIKFTFQQ